MRHASTVLLILLGFLGLAQQTSKAQNPYTSPYYKPPVSPYINLLRPGASPAINYYGIVRPQVQVGAQIQQLDQRAAMLQQNLTTAENATNAIITGHRSTFMNHTKYFLNNGQAGTAGRSPFTATSSTLTPLKQTGSRGAPSGAGRSR